MRRRCCLSHDQHSDKQYRQLRPRVPPNDAARVITTVAGAERLGGRTRRTAAVGDEARWPSRDGQRACRSAATPARHGPAGWSEPSVRGRDRLRPHLQGPTRPPDLQSPASTDSGAAAWPGSRAGFPCRRRSCCCSRARRAHARGRSISPWTPDERDPYRPRLPGSPPVTFLSAA